MMAKRIDFVSLATGEVTHSALLGEKPKPLLFFGKFDRIFREFYRVLLAMKLSGTEYDVIMILIATADQAGRLDLRPSRIAAELGVARETVSRAKRRLVTEKIVVDLDGEWKFNPRFFHRGNYDSIKTDRDRLRLVSRGGVTVDT